MRIKFTSFVCFILCLVLAVGCQETVQEEEVYHSPVGFEEFDTIQMYAKHKVYTDFGDLYGFHLKAMMIAYIDTINNVLLPTTTYYVKHKSGWAMFIESKEPLLDVESFRSFVNKGKVNDTVVNSSFACDIKEHGDIFYIKSISNRSFCFLNVDFSDTPSLLLRADNYHGFVTFDVYRVVEDTVIKEVSEPFCSFRSCCCLWDSDYGTEINYRKKEILVTDMHECSCKDSRIYIKNYYTLDAKTNTFNHRQIEEESYFMD